MRPWQGQPSKLTDEEKQEICVKYQEGMALTTLASIYNAGNETIRGLLIRNGIELRRKPRNKKGRYVSKNGHVTVSVSHDDPYACMANSKGRVAEHRLVMARNLERPLRKEEEVHHIDDNKGNNNPKNLQLRQGKHGKGIAMQCFKCGSSNVGPASI